jgi:AcrR family transcriptional regulator
MVSPRQGPSPRQEELLELSYRYVLVHGLADVSLRPLAAAIGSSPRVLLFLFGSKEGLVRALLKRARTDELLLLARVHKDVGDDDLAAAVKATWLWLSAATHRPLLTLWAEAYARSLVEPDGPWQGFARQTVDDWLALLGDAQPPRRRRARPALIERTVALAVLRGALLDLLATGDIERTTAAMDDYVNSLRGTGRRAG